MLLTYQQTPATVLHETRISNYRHAIKTMSENSDQGLSTPIRFLRSPIDPNAYISHFYEYPERLATRSLIVPKKISNTKILPQKNMKIGGISKMSLGVTGDILHHI